MPDIICCDGCRTGNSKISQLEIEEQRKKYGGVYICKYCEDIIDKINSSNGQNKDFLGSTWANAYTKQRPTPDVIIGTSDNTGMSAQPFMEIMTLKALNDLSLDLEVK